MLQLDIRDVLHSPAAHGLFVVFGCPGCGARDVVPHHPAPSPECRRPDPEVSPGRGDREPRLLPAPPGPAAAGLTATTKPTSPTTETWTEADLEVALLLSAMWPIMSAIILW